ncbi:hypothetical protein OSC52_15325 [Clostridium pasteurianum]|uniref:RNA polymerase sigma factor n=1 Tax=Clostridium pasteurianum TaxID=1501 RepID=UPI002260DD6F|nr:hypothetical protein [Clostridium pasteurianum]UZW13207.1 hypothetical protein OSC52_15325 [Clostridium pasteurianum]
MKNNINISDVISKATKAAIKEYDKEKQQEHRKKVFHNTRLLLSHYNDLKNHVNNAIDDVRKLEDDLTELGDVDRDELYILSIKRSKTKTLIMIAHIDTAMKALKNKEYKLCSIEKFNALNMFFIEDMTYEEIAEKLNCSIITTRRWVNEMINELSINLFGIDGMKLDLI